MAKKPSPIKSLFMSRKAKDQQGLESIKSGGEYVIKSRNKVSDPSNPSQTLPRGSKVSTTIKSQEVVKPGPVKPTTYKDVEISVPNKKYIPGDMQGKTIRDRETTVPLGRLLKEKPAKTDVRIDAQSKGQTSYNYKGKEEYSGRNQTTYEPKKIKVPVPGEQTYTKEKVTTPETKVEYPKDKPKGRSGGVSLAIRRVAGVNNQGKGQNYKRLDATVGKKVIPIIKFRTKTRGS